MIDYYNSLKYSRRTITDQHLDNFVAFSANQIAKDRTKKINFFYQYFKLLFLA